MTIKDLAVLSGYSVGTVSRVLNNHPNVSRSARERVLAIAKQIMGFDVLVDGIHFRIADVAEAFMMIELTSLRIIEPCIFILQ